MVGLYIMNIFKLLMLGLLMMHSIVTCTTQEVLLPTVNHQEVVKHAERITRDVQLRKALLYTVGGMTCGAFAFEVYSIAHSFAHTQEQKSNTVQPEVTPPSISPAADYFSKFGSWVASTGKNILGITIMAVVYEFVSHTISDSMNHIIYTQSIKSFDTHCSRCIPLMQHMQKDIQRVLNHRSSGRGSTIDKDSLICVSRRLVERAEKLLGYMYAKKMNFSIPLQQEASRVEQRVSMSIDEFSLEIQPLLTVAEEDIDYLDLLHVLQKYENILSNEIEHFLFIEEDNQEQ